MDLGPKDFVHVPRRLRPDDDARTIKPADLGRRADDRDLGSKGRALEHHAWWQSNPRARRGHACGQPRLRPWPHINLAVAVLSVAPRHQSSSCRGLMVMGFLVTLAVFFTY